MSAARFNREEIISLLIDKGASMELAITVSIHTVKNAV